MTNKAINKQTTDARANSAPVMTVQQAAEKWGLSGRRVSKLCQDGRIPGAFKPATSFWLIPSSAKKPSDMRVLRGRNANKKKGDKSRG